MWSLDELNLAQQNRAAMQDPGVQGTNLQACRDAQRVCIMEELPAHSSAEADALEGVATIGTMQSHYMVQHQAPHQHSHRCHVQTRTASLQAG